MDNNHPLLSASETADLLAQAQSGDANALERIVRCNQRLAYSIAKRYYDSGFGGDQELEDLLQWANLGLFRAVQKFDAGRGCAFSTYAVGWINGTIRRHARTRGNPLGITDKDGLKLSKIRRVRSELLQSLHREPDPSEIAQRAGLPCEYVKRWLPALQPLRRLDAPPDSPESIDEDRLRYETAPDSEQDLRQELTELLAALNNVEYEVIKRHYLSDPPRSFPQIAHDLGVKQWVVEKIESHAMLKMRGIVKTNLNLASPIWLYGEEKNP